MPTIRLGAPGAIQQPSRFRGALNEPTVEIKSWKGPRTAIEALITQATNGGYNWTFESRGANATIEMEVPIITGGGDPTQDVLVSTWELLPGDSEQDLLASNEIGTLIPANTDKIVKQIGEAIQNGTTPDAQIVAAGTNADKVYKLMRAGVRNIKLFAPVLRHTQTVANGYANVTAVTNASANVRSLMTSAYIIHNESLPSGFLIALTAQPFVQTSTRTDVSLAYSWLKKQPTLQQTYGSRLNITQEWEFGLWSRLMYMNGGPPLTYP